MCGLRFVLGLVVALAVGAPAFAQQIFRTVDEDGNVVFSDVPPAPTEQGEAVDVAPVNTFRAPVIETPPPGEASEPEKALYRYLEITSPADDEPVRDNAGDVTITAQIEPRLRPNHRMVLVLDGNQTEMVAEGGQFFLSNVDRGTHTVAVRVLDRSGTPLIESEPRTFHLQRYRLPTPTPF